MKENIHIQAIPADVLTQVQTKMQEVQTLLAPYMLALTPEERRELPKMGAKTIAFVEKAYDFARQNPNLVPPYLDIDARGKKRQLFGSEGNGRDKKPRRFGSEGNGFGKKENQQG